MRVQTTEKAIIRKEKHLEDDGEVDDDDEVIYKIEVAANRSADFVFVNGIEVTRILGRYTGVWKPGENLQQCLQV